MRGLCTNLCATPSPLATNHNTVCAGPTRAWRAAARRYPGSGRCCTHAGAGPTGASRDGGIGRAPPSTDSGGSSERPGGKNSVGGAANGTPASGGASRGNGVARGLQQAPANTAASQRGTANGTANGRLPAPPPGGIPIPALIPAAYEDPWCVWPSWHAP